MGRKIADGHLLQISPLTKNEDGSYECHASNIQGEASAVGTIHVVDSINDIPPKKGEWVQLTDVQLISPFAPIHASEIKYKHSMKNEYLNKI